MLDTLREKISQHLLADAMKNVSGNQAQIRQEKMSKVNQLLNVMWPDLAQAANDAVGVVRDHLASCEQQCVVARENTKLAQEQVTAATKTLEASLQAVAAANIHAESAMQAVRASAAALTLAKDEFSKLVSRG